MMKMLHYSTTRYFVNISTQETDVNISQGSVATRCTVFQ